jgi:enoyl-CoA hydratase/carnithine racemase
LGSPVLIQHSGGVARLTLIRRDKLSAFNRHMHAELRAGLQKAAADPACVAFLEKRPAMFSGRKA